MDLGIQLLTKMVANLQDELGGSCWHLNKPIAANWYACHAIAKLNLTLTPEVQR